ncbi:MAG: hypothetical protein KQH53_04030 [Desulfarculaceae bacterium]|nr:hypothetical protein [Desulfarculaceae bacterium]
MRRAMIFLLAGVLTLGLAAGAMAWGGFGMMGGGYGHGWGGGHMMQPGYHMGYGQGYAQGYGPNGAAPGYGPANCPGWQAWSGQQPQGYGPGYGPAPAPRGPVTPAPPADSLE